MKQATLTALILLAALTGPLSASGGALDMRPQGIQVLYYGKGVMRKVALNHMNPAFKRTGDYVPTMRLTPAELQGCLVAVNWNSRHWVAQNTRLTIDFWDRVDRRWERHTCRAADWQQRRHSTGSRQRFELDWETALAVHAVPNNTIAKIVRIER